MLIFYFLKSTKLTIFSVKKKFVFLKRYFRRKLTYFFLACLFKFKFILNLFYYWYYFNSYCPGWSKEPIFRHFFYWFAYKHKFSFYWLARDNWHQDIIYWKSNNDFLPVNYHFYNDEFLSLDCDFDVFRELSVEPKKSLFCLLPKFSFLYYNFFKYYVASDLFEDEFSLEEEEYDPENLNDLFLFYNLFFFFEEGLRLRKYKFLIFFLSFFNLHYSLLRWVFFFFSLELSLRRQISFLLSYTYFISWPYLIDNAFDSFYMRKRFIISTKKSVVNSIFFTRQFFKRCCFFQIVKFLFRFFFDYMFSYKNPCRPNYLSLFSFKSISFLQELGAKYHEKFGAFDSSLLQLIGRHTNFFILKDASKFESFLFLLVNKVTFFFCEYLTLVLLMLIFSFKSILLRSFISIQINHGNLSLGAFSIS